MALQHCLYCMQWPYIIAYISYRCHTPLPILSTMALHHCLYLIQLPYTIAYIAYSVSGPKLFHTFPTVGVHQFLYWPNTISYITYSGPIPSHLLLKLSINIYYILNSDPTPLPTVALYHILYYLQLPYTVVDIVYRSLTPFII